MEGTVFFFRMIGWCFRLILRAITVIVPFIAGWWAARQKQKATPYKHLPTGTHGTARFENPANVGLLGNSDGFIVGLKH